jgi:nucleoid DNA-binding protein
MLRKRDLDLIVARQMTAQASLRMVRRITKEFIRAISEGLVGGERIVLDGLGALKVDAVSDGRKTTISTFKNRKETGKREIVPERYIQVYFSKGRSLASELKEKYHGEVRRRRKRK